MKRGLKITFILLGILATLAFICVTVFLVKWYNHTLAKTTAVIVRADENSMVVMGMEDNGLYIVGFTDEENKGFKPNQEIAIYYDGSIADTYPAQFGNVGKIKIIKEKSDIIIPENILKYAYSSKSNVHVSISKLTKTGISFMIIDTNELPYHYSDTYRYTVERKVKNKDYTGIGYKIGEDTPNSVAGYTGTGLEFIWEEVKKISDVPPKDTITTLSNKTEEAYLVEGRKIDWTSLYGELPTGEYKLVFHIEEDFTMTIDFKIEDSGQITMDTPNLL